MSIQSICAALSAHFPQSRRGRFRAHRAMHISEDSGAFLEVVPGNFIFIGNGTASDKGGLI
ncbi:MAG: hypothetical protein EPN70_21320 [Paraburkholderia sp.]|nr:MAG: hypothetical protein EPN70_21320 [Paraburkholderia sp.]